MTGTEANGVKPVCPWCWYARDREDICGVYCVADYENKDGNCTHFLDYEKEKERRDAFLELRGRKGKESR